MGPYFIFRLVLTAPSVTSPAYRTKKMSYSILKYISLPLPIILRRALRAIQSVVSRVREGVSLK